MCDFLSLSSPVVSFSPMISVFPSVKFLCSPGFLFTSCFVFCVWSSNHQHDFKEARWWVFFMCDVWDIKVQLDQPKDLTIQTKQRSCEITHEGLKAALRIILMVTPENKSLKESNHQTSSVSPLCFTLLETGWFSLSCIETIVQKVCSCKRVCVWKSLN